MTTNWESAPIAPHRGGESIPRIPDALIYEALAQGWVRSAPGLPGQHDREWAELAGQSPWPGAGRRRAGGPAEEYPVGPPVNAAGPYGRPV